MCGAGSRARTDGIQVGNLTLYQLSYARTLFFVSFLKIAYLTEASCDDVEDSPLEVSAY